MKLEPRNFEDSRGFFMETYQKEIFSQNGIPFDFIQDNHSFSRHGVLRGLHYQVIHPQGKLVRAVSGEIFDVAVDLRKSSENFGKWVGTLLSAENHLQLWVPPGFAHGYYVLGEQADVLYKTTDTYHPESERCIRWDDPDLDIHWPIPAGDAPILSEKDANGSLFIDAEVYT
jgi:dTDP-4-dehydrorhamnose 3,5-epimerase